MAATVVALVGFSASVQAVPISGVINFGTSSSATVNSGNLGTATAISSYGNVFVSAGTETGSYAPLNGGGNFGSTLAFSTFGFGGNVLSPASVLLWTVASGGVTYSFTATSVQIVLQNSTFLDLQGNGSANITGYDSTIGTWSMLFTGLGGTTTFTFGAATAVPDNGTTVMLLGAAFAGLCLFRKKVMA